MTDMTQVPVEKLEYHTRCHDCGRFLPKVLWVRKDDPLKKWVVCFSCHSDYDDLYCDYAL